SHRRNAI
ncbi:hypothetical protein TNIN_475101, partial [Trichonephila inaurata madagascariensis]